MKRRDGTVGTAISPSDEAADGCPQLGPLRTTPINIIATRCAPESDAATHREDAPAFEITVSVRPALRIVQP